MKSGRHEQRLARLQRWNSRVIQVSYSPAKEELALLNADGDCLTHEEFYELMELSGRMYSSVSPGGLAQRNIDRRALYALQQVMESVYRREKRQAQAGYIYVLSASTLCHKIGRTIALGDRLKTLAIQLPFKVEVTHTFPTADTAAAEAYLHLTFAHKRMNGEWFALDEHDLAWVSSHETWDLPPVPMCDSWVYDRDLCPEGADIRAIMRAQEEWD